jgi:predicted DNA-binding transcriptional regulator YafY
MDMNYTRKIKTISDAINGKNAVVITYNGEEKSRIINPYVVYNSTKGISSLDAFQVQGNSVSDTLLKFKIFHVDKIDSIALHSDTFQIHESYNPDSDRYKESFIKIAL